MRKEKLLPPRLGALLAVVALLPAQWVAAQVAHQHHPPESASEYIKVLEAPEREEWQQPERVIAALGLKPGDIVADLGAGSGYFTVRLARVVSPGGKVYAVDIDRQLLGYIERRAKEEHLQNIQPILADPHDPKLPPSSVDLIFICDTLHHISDRPRYYPFLARALNPGGRLVNIDFQKQPLPVGPPVEMKISKRAMIEEARPAGFHLLKEYDFLKYEYFLVFTR
jgi:ubiquinone/menaquinone biosynthesis C-methylase UbiE